MAVYIVLGTGEVRVCPLYMWSEVIEVEGKRRPRFRKESPLIRRSLSSNLSDPNDED